MAQNTERSVGTYVKIDTVTKCRVGVQFLENVTEFVVNKLDVTDGVAVGRKCCIHVAV